MTLFVVTFLPFSHQNVVRNWYGRQPNIVKVVDDLADNAKTLAKALEDGRSGHAT